MNIELLAKSLVWKLVISFSLFDFNFFILIAKFEIRWKVFSYLELDLFVFVISPKHLPLVLVRWKLWLLQPNSWIRSHYCLVLMSSCSFLGPFFLIFPVSTSIFNPSRNTPRKELLFFHYFILVNASYPSTSYTVSASLLTGLFWLLLTCFSPFTLFTSLLAFGSKLFNLSSQIFFYKT